MNDLVRECKALTFLSLRDCGFLQEGDPDEAPLPELIIDAPQSRLSYLQFSWCNIDRVDLVQAPSLRMFRYDWLAEDASPVSFGYTPSLQSLFLSHYRDDGDDDEDDNVDDDDDDNNNLKLSNVLVKGEQLGGLFLGFENGKVREITAKFDMVTN